MLSRAVRVLAFIAILGLVFALHMAGRGEPALRTDVEFALLGTMVGIVTVVWRLAASYRVPSSSELAPGDDEAAFSRRAEELDEELTDEIRAKMKSLERLTSEVEDRKQLASIDSEAAAAVEEMLARKNKELVQQLQRQKRSRAIGSAIFNGVVLALLVGVVGNYVFTWISTGQLPPVILP